MIDLIPVIAIVLAAAPIPYMMYLFRKIMNSDGTRPVLNRARWVKIRFLAFGTIAMCLFAAVSVILLYQ